MMRTLAALLLGTGLALCCGCGPQVTGACCDDGMCLMVTETDCFNRGGTYYGGGSSCDTRRCPSGDDDANHR